MSYVVVWNSTATDRVDAAFATFEGAQRQELVTSLTIVERQITQIPLEVGESRATINERVLIEPPLVVCFEVDLSTNMVRVLSARIASLDY